VVQPRYDELWEDDEKAQGPLEYEFRLIFSSDLGNVNQYNEILDKLT
jgi:carbohydrate-selective porin OprB